MRKRGPRYEKRKRSASAVVTRLPKSVVQRNRPQNGDIATAENVISVNISTRKTKLCTILMESQKVKIQLLPTSRLDLDVTLFVRHF